MAADLIVTNDIASVESDGLPSTVLNSGVRLLRSSPWSHLAIPPMAALKLY